MKAESKGAGGTKKAIAKSSSARTNKHKNKLIKDRNLFLGNLIDTMPDAMIATDLQSNILEWNAAAEKIYGWKASEVLGKQLDEILQTASEDTDANEASRIMQEMGAWSGEVTQMHRTGKRIPIWSRVSLTRDESGEPIGFIGINRDMTEHRQVQEQLRQSEERFSKAFHSTPTALVLTRLSDSKFEYVNESFLKLVNYQLDEVIGKSPYEINLFPDPTQLVKVRELLIETGMVRNLETTVRSRTGEVKHVIFSVDMIELQQQPYSLTTMVDITERVRAEKQVVQMKRLYATLSQVNQTIVRVKSREELYQSICDVAQKFGGLTLAWVGLLDEATGDVQPVAASGMGMDVAHWPFPIINIYKQPSLNGVIAEALHTSNTSTSDDVQSDERTKALHSTTQKYEFRSLASVPFRLRGKTIGVLNMISVEPGIFKAEEELKLLDEMGLDISFALDTMATRTEQKLAEELLRQSEQKFFTLFMKAPFAIQLSRIPDGTIVDVNEEFERLIGYSREEAVGRTSLELNMYPDPEIRARLKAEFDTRGYAHNIEIVLRRKSGDLLHILASSDIMDIGGAKYILTTAQNITESKRAEEQLRYQAHLLGNINDAIVASDANYVLKAWNQAAEKMYGWKAEEVLGRKGVPILQTQFLNADAEEMRKKIAELGYYLGEATQLRKDGVRIPVEIASSVLRNERGEITDYVSVNRDISERKQAEENLRQSEKKFSDAFRQSPAAMTITRIADGTFVDANEAFLHIFEFTRDEVIGHTSTELNILDLETRRTLIERQLSSGGLRNAELQARSKSGKIISILFSSSAIEIEQEPHHITTMIDITDRKQAEESLRIENQRFQRFVESNIVGIIIADASGRIVTANDYYLTLLGLTRQDFSAGKVDWRKFTPPEWLSADETAIRELREHGVCEPYEKEYERIDGTRVPVYIADAMLPGPEEQIVAFVLDITERKRAEEQIQRQLQRLSGLRMIDTAITSSFNLHVTLETVLEQVLSLLGVDASALLLFNDQSQTIEYAASRGFRSDALHHTQLKSGEGFAGRAILERKTIHVSDLTEIQGSLVNALQLENETFVEYFGTPLIVKGEVKGVLEIYNRTALQTGPEWLEFLETLAGQAAIAVDNAQLFENLQRSNRDLEQRVTERTAELNQVNLELEHANRAKDEFLANMSHELRTPLNSILGLSESLLEQRRGTLNEHQQKSLQVIETSGQHLLDLINDILDLSKIEAGKFDFHPQPVSVDELCKSSLAFIKSQATKKSIGITYINDSPMSQIFADPRRLKQILVNLLTNAVKFTPEMGAVSLQVKFDPGNELIRFSVVDTGIGIALQDLQRLFQPFVQVDSGLNRQHAGTGLGLAIVQKLTEMHGGSVHVESEVGKGSRFTIILGYNPEILKTSESSASQVTPPATNLVETTSRSSETPSHLQKILLAEDNTASIMTLRDYLEGHDYEVIIAQDGLEVIARAEETKPDIILMDIQMPVMNGLEAITRLRADPRFSEIPIIALTALAMPGDRERCLAAGANEYISKPVRLKTLLKVIASFLDGK